jgi:hypothetical protein
VNYLKSFKFSVIDSPTSLINDINIKSLGTLWNRINQTRFQIVGEGSAGASVVTYNTKWELCHEVKAHAVFLTLAAFAAPFAVETS